MKILVMTLMLILSSSIYAKSPTANKKNTAVPKYSSAVTLGTEEFQVLTGAYEASHNEQTLGGVISRQALVEILNSMPYGANFINFRFTNEDARLSLMLMGGKSWYEGTRKIPCYRNTGKAASFCPSVCEMEVNEEGTTQSFLFQEYLDRTAAYHQKFPSSTQGGNLDKAALKALLASLPEGQKNIAFRFCIDPTFNQTSVIFVGGIVGQPESKPLIIRNGVDANSFCPTLCEVRD